MSYVTGYARAKFIALLTATLLTITSATTVSYANDKMKVEEVAAKHLQSIGSVEARAAVKSRIMLGTCSVIVQGRATGAGDGQAVLASEKANYLIVMKFVSPDYPHELIGFDGKNLTAGYVRPGVRSSLANFLLMHNTVFEQGIMGGALSSAWPLLNLAAGDVKLEYDGTGKVGDKRVYKLRYSPRRGADLQITLLFDAETFQHLRTQYERIIAPQMGRDIDNSARQSETRYKMVEDFSEFKRAGDLTLPHVYKLQLSVTGNSGTLTHNWTLNLREFNFNRPIDVKSFNINSY